MRFVPYLPWYQGSACARVASRQTTKRQAARTAHTLPRCGTTFELDGAFDQRDELFAVRVVAGSALREIANRLERPMLGILAAAEHVGKRGDGEREPEVGRCIRERGGRSADHRE